jgi:Tfp pilus assembly protein PilN
MTVFNINLIAARRRQKQRAVRLLRIGFYSLIGLVAVVIVVYLKMNLTVAQVTAEIARIDGELSQPELAKATTRIQFLESETAQLTPRVAVLEKVHSSEAEWIRILHDLSACIPANVGISQMTSSRADKGQALELRGKALTQSDIGEFMLALDQPVWSGIPALGFSQTTGGTTTQAELVEFEITVPLQSVIGSDLK